jgi:hypothetical protein
MAAAEQHALRHGGLLLVASRRPVRLN